MEKDHFRNAYKSDHLGVIDLKGLLEKKHNLIFTIKEVKQEFNSKVAGRVLPIANILYFYDDIKPLVLNAGNSKILSGFFNSTYVTNWKDIKIQLYIDHSAKLKGEIVGGVRISPNLPILSLPKLTKENTKVWNNAIKAIREGKGVQAIKVRYELTEEIERQLIEESK